MKKKKARLILGRGGSVIFRSINGSEIYQAKVEAHFRLRNNGGDMLLLSGIRKHKPRL